MGPSTPSKLFDAGLSRFCATREPALVLTLPVALFATLGFSFLFSIGFFTTVLAMIGPQNDCGSFKQIAACCRSYCSGPDDFDDDSDDEENDGRTEPKPQTKTTV